jgi:hypothetical protein
MDTFRRLLCEILKYIEELCQTPTMDIKYQGGQVIDLIITYPYFDITIDMIAPLVNIPAQLNMYDFYKLKCLLLALRNNANYNYDNSYTNEIFYININNDNILIVKNTVVIKLHKHNSIILDNVIEKYIKLLETFPVFELKNKKYVGENNEAMILIKEIKNSDEALRLIYLGLVTKHNEYTKTGHEFLDKLGWII